MSCRVWELVAHRALPGRVARRGKLLEMPWLAFPASFSCRGLVLRVAFPASSSCRGLVASGGLPGKLLLLGPCLLFLNTLFLNGSKGATEGLGSHPASLAAGRCDCPCTISRY